MAGADPRSEPCSACEWFLCLPHILHADSSTAYWALPLGSEDGQEWLAAAGHVAAGASVPVLQGHAFACSNTTCTLSQHPSTQDRRLHTGNVCSTL